MASKASRTGDTAPVVMRTVGASTSACTRSTLLAWLPVPVMKSPSMVKDSRSAAPAPTDRVTSPSALGVTVNLYVVPALSPGPGMNALATAWPLVTRRSETSKPRTDSEKVTTASKGPFTGSLASVETVTVGTAGTSSSSISRTRTVCVRSVFSSTLTKKCRSSSSPSLLLVRTVKVPDALPPDVRQMGPPVVRSARRAPGWSSGCWPNSWHRRRCTHQARCCLSCRLCIPRCSAGT